jgi:acyl-CoA reductase-like NAD-dependent aldehyde dehydrogenase
LSLDRIFIGGAFEAASDGPTVDVTHPATEQVVGTVPQAPDDDVDRAFAAAAVANPGPPDPLATR